MFLFEYDEDLHNQTLREEGRAEGIVEGMEKGIEKGMEKGMKKGRAEERKSLIISLDKQGVSRETIAAATSLPIEQVSAIIGQI